MVFAVLAVVFWLAPFFVSGWTGRTWQWLPRGLAFQHTAAGLFTQRTPSWWDHHIEGERMDGTRFEMPEKLLFPTAAFGFRSKYDRIMNESVRSRRVRQIRLRLAEHIFSRWQHLGNNLEDLKAVRLVRSIWRVGSPGMAAPEGAWSPPPVTGIPADQKVLLGGYHRTSGRVRAFWQEGDPMPQLRKTVPPPMPHVKKPMERKLVPLVK